MEIDLNLLKEMSAEYAEAKNVAIKGICSFCTLSQVLETGTFSILSWKFFFCVKPSLCFPCHLKPYTSNKLFFSVFSPGNCFI